MDIATVAQIFTAATNTLFVVVLAAVYYTWRVGQRTLEETRVPGSPS